MPLPWVRLDVNIGTHDKIISLTADPSPKRWQAAFSYCAALGWSGGAGTDGRVPASVLPFVHGTKQTADLLVKHGLWEPVTGAWQIVNFAEYQQLSAATSELHLQQSIGARKGNCRRWHGSGCWISDEKGCSRE